MATNAPEEQPYVLSVGTEVSAKFKGAFCEAKIKRVDRSVKCKLNFKNSSESVTLVESQVLGANGQPIGHNELKIGSTVFVGGGSELKQATLVKILDQSVYNVVFNDGDERSLKRSFIRFKGEKHFLDSETLNNAPLNNPEHFLFPISKLEGNETPGVPNKSKTRYQANKKAENESDTDSKVTTKKLKTDKKDNDADSKANESVSENDQSDKSGSAESTDEENSSDDYPAEEKDRFVAQLYKFMDDRGTPLNQLPSINRIDLDLHKFFIVVKKFGGFNRVCRQRLWFDVYKRLGLSNGTSSNVINLKCAYKRYLHPYEDFYRKLGSTVCDLPSLRQASSASVSRRLSSSDSRRQLFKPRFLATPIAASSASKKTPAPGNKGKKGQANETVASTVVVEPSLVTSDLPSASNPDLKRSVSQTENDSDNETKEEGAISQNLFMSNSVATSNESNDEQSSQNCSEELTIFSMVQTIKAKKEKEKEISSNATTNIIPSSKKSTDNSAVKSTPIKAQSGVKEPVAKSASLSVSTTSKRPLSAGNGKKDSTSRRLSSDKVIQPSSVGSSSSATAKKSKSDTNQLGVNSDGEYDGEDEEDEPKTKKKNARYIAEESSSSSSTTKGSTKRKNSLSSKNNANDPEHDAGDLVPITIHDLDSNQLIEVKYGNGKQVFKAKIIEIDTDKNKLLVHYPGWNARYDEWIDVDRIIKVHGDQFCGNKKRKAIVKPAVSAQNSSEATTSSNSNSSSSKPTSSKVDSPTVTNEKPSAKASQSATQNTTQSKVKESVKRQSSPSITGSNSSTNSDPPANTPVSTASSTKKPIESVPAKSVKEEDPKPVKSSESSTSCVSEPAPVSNDNALQHSGSNTSVKSVCSFDSLIEMTIKNEYHKEITTHKISEGGSEASSDKIFSIQSIKKEIVEFDTNTENESAAENNAKSECSSSSNLISAIVAQELLDSPSDPIDLEPVVAAESVSSKSSESEKRRSSEMEKTKKDKFMLRRSSEQTNHETVVAPKVSKAPAKNNDSEKPETTNIFFKNKKKATEETSVASTTSVVEFKKPEETEVKSDKEVINKENDFQAEKNKNKKSNKQEEPAVKESTTSSNENSNKKSAIELSNLTNNSSNKPVEEAPKQPAIEYKFPFHLIGCTLVGKQRIRFIEEQMRLCRDEYNKRKNEVAEIDRKKKRLRRSLQERQLASSSSSGANLNHSTTVHTSSTVAVNDDKPAIDIAKK